MKKLNPIFKVSVLLLFAVVLVSSCLKTEEPQSIYTAEREAGLMKVWLDAQVLAKKDIDTTSTGILYIAGKVGAGKTITTGDTVTVKYTGKYTDGTVFDSSPKFVYVHKSSKQRLIQGWEEGMEVLKKGGGATFLIPSAKAYGTSGYYTIPPYTPLIFVIEVIDIK